MADISLDEAMAKIWLDDVATEVAEVDVILTKVTSALTTTIDSEDTIMQGIYNVGTLMEDTWSTMCNVLKETAGHLVEAVGIIGKGVAQGLDWLGEIKSKLNL